MAEWKKNAGLEEALLQHYTEEGKKEEEVVKSGGRSIMSVLWVVLSVIATLAGRRILRTGFPYPFYFVFLIQLATYLIVAITVLLSRLVNFRRAKRKSDEEYEFRGLFILGCRTLASSIFSGVAVLCGAKALMLSSNLPILAMLPILTYVCDSIFSRIFYALHLLPRGQNISAWRFPKVLLVIVGVVLAVYQDYHLEIEALTFALAAFSLSSLSKVISRIGPKIYFPSTRTWQFSLYIYLLAGIIPLVMTCFASSKLENMVAAGRLARSWTIPYLLINILPAVALHGLFSSSLNSAYPFISEEHVGGALEEPSEVAREAAANTLHASFWIFVIGVLGQETNFIDWFQVVAFTLIYIISVGPKTIAYYPTRVLNTIPRILHQRPLPTHAEPWKFRFFLAATTIVFAVLVGTTVMYWVNTFAYHRNLKSWHGPKIVSLDTEYQPPRVRSFDIVIAHSAGDPFESIESLISTVVLDPQISNLNPRITIYTKDPIYNSTIVPPNSLKALLTGRPIKFQHLPNIGGPTGTFLYHILYSWSFLPVQTLFLSTASNKASTLPLFRDRLTTYFVPPGYPLPDALPKSGFLNLGPQETCSCTTCFDSLGWEDSFHLMPSMFGAVHPDTPNCDSIILTRGNSFIASAARIRGVKMEVWQLLYDALINEDWRNAWAHNSEKLPVRLEGEENVGRWGKGGVFEGGDSLEAPFLGLTVERLWGVLLQCSEAKLAWACPSIWRDVRMGGRQEDCGCID